MNMKSRKGKFYLGALIGAGAALLFAPTTGRETRRKLKKKLDELVAKAKEVDINEVKDEFVEKANAIKEELENLDKERALDIAKEQGKKLQKKAESLYNYAKEKGTPILIKTADEIRKQAASITKEISKKLEEAEIAPAKKTTKKTTSKKN